MREVAAAQEVPECRSRAGRVEVRRAVPARCVVEVHGPEVDAEPRAARGVLYCGVKRRPREQHRSARWAEGADLAAGVHLLLRPRLLSVVPTDLTRRDEAARPIPLGIVVL